MAWVRLADDFADHPKIVAAGPLAGWLWTCGLAYANRYLTDGFIPTAQVRRLADVEDAHGLAAKLCEVGLWERTEGGFLIHDYHGYQPSAETVKEERKAAAERQSAWRERQRLAKLSNGTRNGVTNPPCDAAPARPGPGPVNPVPAVVNPSQTLPLRGKGSAGAGPISQDVVERLSRLDPDGTAAEFHDAAEAELSEIGFSCEREVPVDERGDGRSGRVDLLAERDGERIAFEFDRWTPRQKSIRKLAGLSSAKRVVVLRGPFTGPPPKGLDAVIGNAVAAPEPAPVELTPATPEDGRVWNQARAALEAEMNAPNFEVVCSLEPIGRAPDGGLHLRAPPSWPGAGRFRTVVARALFDAGDQAAKHTVIVEARTSAQVNGATRGHG